MKNLLDKSAKFNRIEFWAVITIYVFQVFFFISDAIENGYSDMHAPGKQFFDQANADFGFYRNYLIPSLIRFTLLFLLFLLLNFKLVPKLLRKESVGRNSFFIVLIFFLSVVLYAITNSYTKGYLFSTYPTTGDAYTFLFQNSFLYVTWLFLAFVCYSAIKYSGIYLLSNSEEIESKYGFLNKETLVAIVIWMFSTFLLVFGGAEEEIVAIWVTIVLSAISIYAWSHYSFIPKSLGKRRPFLGYMIKVLITMVLLFLLVSILLLMAVDDEDSALGLSFFNSIFQLFITAPISWVIFKRKMKGNEELYSLRRELGQTHANFDFLRSQINPHFLFNALNTIYGTAIQEKAERTSEGIEKLADMMRFMLQENMQEKIPLSREIDYLKNYIDLQKLRTDPNPNVKIQTTIEPPASNVQVSPMLLIPFVENAFKHGISLREPSHISITLEIKENTLYFDVYNSKHPRQENDPEENKNGIGLNNVKQRLQLVYANKHKLMIRETTKEFFVHLTMELI